VGVNQKANRQTDNINNRKIIGFVTQTLIIIACEIINVVAFNSLIVPAKLLSGGVVGTALLLHQLFELPIGLQTIIYNIPIFLIGYRFLGKRFVALSMVGVGAFSLFADNLRVPVVTKDLLLIAIFGGIVTGIADGIILRSGGSTGGLDIVGLIVSKRFGMSIGQIFLAFNGVIITISALANQNIELAMYTLIMLFVSTRTIDTLVRATPRPVALIISPRHEDIAAQLMNDLHRGVTYLQGSGAYTSTEYQLMLCVLSRYELVDLKRILHEIDPNAFTIILDASDVMGNFDQRTIFRKLISRPQQGDKLSSGSG
jgi:uncharacterized membrane-anchored protein YitT (DUF2179 family)